MQGLLHRTSRLQAVWKESAGNRHSSMPGLALQFSSLKARAGFRGPILTSTSGSRSPLRSCWRSARRPQLMRAATGRLRSNLRSFAAMPQSFSGPQSQSISRLSFSALQLSSAQGHTQPQANVGAENCKKPCSPPSWM